MQIIVFMGCTIQNYIFCITFNLISMLCWTGITHEIHTAANELNISIGVFMNTIFIRAKKNSCEIICAHF